LEALRSNLEEELDFIESVAENNFKNYQIWFGLSLSLLSSHIVVFCKTCKTLNCVVASMQCMHVCFFPWLILLFEQIFRKSSVVCCVCIFCLFVRESICLSLLLLLMQSDHDGFEVQFVVNQTGESAGFCLHIILILLVMFNFCCMVYK
jgi:hypothetical protein